jgi:acetyl esterase/lipase
MPPDSRFPTAVEDAFAVYRFVVDKLWSVCNINPLKIILAGDSAGGNLVCALMGLILQHKLPSPAGLFLAYPACSLRVGYSPSRLHSFFTPILHPSLLYLCLKEYLGPDF